MTTRLPTRDLHAADDGCCIRCTGARCFALCGDHDASPQQQGAVNVPQHGTKRMLSWPSSAWMFVRHRISSSWAGIGDDECAVSSVNPHNSKRQVTRYGRSPIRFNDPIASSGHISALLKANHPDWAAVSARRGGPDAGSGDWRRRKDLGGFEVGRVLPFTRRRMVGPFIFFDHMGPVDFPPGIPRTVDVRPHPHIGLSTVTYLFDGEIMHRDSVGVRAGDPARRGELDDRRPRHHPLRALRGARGRGRARCTASRPGWRCRKSTRRPTRPSPTTARRTCRCLGKRASGRG